MKLYLIGPDTSDSMPWSVADTLSYNKPHYQEVLLPILYIRTLIDPPDLA
ncbi:MAG: hypothetical protein AAFP19_15340 [Bacteroidota bacterium]